VKKIEKKKIIEKEKKEIKEEKVKIDIVTNPKEAKIFIEDRFIGLSPITLSLDKGKLQRIFIKKDGFKTEVLKILAEKEEKFSLKLKKKKIKKKKKKIVKNIKKKGSPVNYVTKQPKRDRYEKFDF